MRKRQRIGAAARVCLGVILSASVTMAQPRAHEPYEPDDAGLFDSRANLLLTAKVAGSPHWGDRKPQFAVDGRHDHPGDHWAAEHIPVQFTAELAEARPMNTIRLWTYWGEGRYYQYSIEGSTDGSQWILLADARANTTPASAAGRVFTFPTRPVRFVRTTFTRNSVSDEAGGHIVEIEAYCLAPEVIGPLLAWEKLAPGLHGGIGSVDERYPRERVPGIAERGAWSGTAWRGERVNGQAVLWTADGARQVRFEFSGFRNPAGDEIPASCLRTRFVRYVLADGRLQPDVLDTAARGDVGARSARPVWITIDVPADAKPGGYGGRLVVRSEGGATIPLDLKLEVQAQRLPPPAEWSFHLDLWQNPWALARYHHVEPFSPEHWALLEPHLTMLAEAGQKCITTAIVHDPWGGQTYDAYGTMIEWIRTREGGWRYDYAIFDRYVQLCDRCGIRRQINCYSMAPWTNRFRYLDEATGDYRVVEAATGTPAWEAHWRPFLADFAGHLKGRGWLERTTIAMDERPLDIMRQVLALVRQAAPELGVSLAGNYHAEIRFDVRDLSLLIEPATQPASIRERVSRRLPTTFYICCTPDRPNTFPASPPVESVWMGWHAASRGYTGLLRWAYDSWVADPLLDTTHVSWTAGDCFMVYPGPRSSIRFERLREGIQDFEKIRILRAEIAGSGGPAAARRLERLEEALKPFTFAAARREGCGPMVAAGKAVMVEMSREIAADRAGSP